MKSQLSRFVLSGLLATGLTLSSAAAFAQQDNAPPAPDASTPQQGSSHGQWGGHPQTPDEQVARMTQRYNLSSDQQTQIKPILANQQQQMQALRQDSSLSRDDKMAKMKSIRVDSSTKIQAVLNDSQKQKFAQDQQRMQERMQERGGQGGGPAASN
jgi:Spy/CpxP family protein refolding chaperone